MAEQEVIGKLTVDDQKFDRLSPREDDPDPHNGDLLGILSQRGLVIGTVIKMGGFTPIPRFQFQYPPEMEGEYAELDDIEGERMYLRRSNPDEESGPQSEVSISGGRDLFSRVIARQFLQAILDKESKDTQS